MFGSRPHRLRLLADWKGEAGSRRSGVAARATIRAGGAESADILRSDREHAEGFHLTSTSAVAGPVRAVTVAVLSRIVIVLTFT
jgi:hypothetical protein